MFCVSALVHLYPDCVNTLHRESIDLSLVN